MNVNLCWQSWTIEALMAQQGWLCSASNATVEDAFATSSLLPHLSSMTCVFFSLQLRAIFFRFINMERKDEIRDFFDFPPIRQDFPPKKTRWEVTSLLVLFTNKEWTPTSTVIGIELVMDLTSSNRFYNMKKCLLSFLPNWLLSDFLESLWGRPW